MKYIDTPKARARRLIKHHIETPGHTLEHLFVEIAKEIDEAQTVARNKALRLQDIVKNGRNNIIKRGGDQKD